MARGFEAGTSKAAATTGSSAPRAKYTACVSRKGEVPTVHSQDGAFTVFVEVDSTIRDATAMDDIDHQRICILRKGEGSGRVLLEGRGMTSDAGVETILADFGNLVLTKDGKTLYFTTTAWVTSGAAHAVDIATSSERFLVDGAVVRVLNDGPFKGNLLATHYRLDDVYSVDSPKYRGRMETWSVLSPTGKELKRLPESDVAREKVLRGH